MFKSINYKDVVATGCQRTLSRNLCHRYRAIWRKQKTEKVDDDDTVTIWRCVFCNAVYRNKYAPRMQNYILNSCIKASKEANKAVKEFSSNLSLKKTKSYFLILSRINWVVFKKRIIFHRSVSWNWLERG